MRAQGVYAVTWSTVQSFRYDALSSFAMIGNAFLSVFHQRSGIFPLRTVYPVITTIYHRNHGMLLYCTYNTNIINCIFI